MKERKRVVITGCGWTRKQSQGDKEQGEEKKEKRRKERQREAKRGNESVLLLLRVEETDRQTDRAQRNRGEKNRTEKGGKRGRLRGERERGARVRMRMKERERETASEPCGYVLRRQAGRSGWVSGCQVVQVGGVEWREREEGMVLGWMDGTASCLSLGEGTTTQRNKEREEKDRIESRTAAINAQGGGFFACLLGLFPPSLLLRSFLCSLFARWSLPLIDPTGRFPRQPHSLTLSPIPPTAGTQNTHRIAWQSREHDKEVRGSRPTLFLPPALSVVGRGLWEGGKVGQLQGNKRGKGFRCTALHCTPLHTSALNAKTIKSRNQNRSWTQFTNINDQYQCTPASRKTTLSSWFFLVCLGGPTFRFQQSRRYDFRGGVRRA